MTRFPRSALAAATAAGVLAFSLSACGGDSDSSGDDGPPTDASKEEYCGIVNDPKYFEELNADSDEQDYVDAVQEIADDLRDVGTPDDISGDARGGFEIQLDAVDDLEAEDISFDADEDPILEGLSDGDQEKVEAYREYESETCPDETDIGTPDDPEAS